MRKWFRPGFFKSLLQQQLLSFLALSLIPLIVLTVSAQRNAERSVLEYADQQAESTMDLIVYNIDRQFSHYIHLTEFITRDRQLSDLDAESAGSAFDRIRTLLKGYRDSVYNVEYCGTAYEDGFVVTSSGMYADGADYMNQAWYRDCLESPNEVFTRAFGSGQSPFERIFPTYVNSVLFYKAMADSDGRICGIGFVSVSGNILESSTGSIADRKGSFVYILDQDGLVVHSPVEGRIPEVAREDMYLHLSSALSSVDWTLYGEINIEAPLRQIRNTQRSTLKISILLVALILIVSISFTRAMLKPIDRLYSSMQRAQQGDLNVRCEESGPTELKNLSAIFNGMLERIRSLLEQVYNEQRSKRKAEMAALQANIKPHFLYNTLDTICWMASQYHADDIVETVESLSNLFRISLSKGSETIPLEDEIMHVTSYLQIQKVRYEDKLDYEIDVAEDCKAYKVQKLILQPIVENALYHGIKESDHNGMIHIRVWKADGKLYLQISDDGIGMKRERLEEVRDVLNGVQKSNTGVYGIRNVQERLVLSYGSEYGLTIESEYLKGTTCTICHPLLEV